MTRKQEIDTVDAPGRGEHRAKERSRQVIDDRVRHQAPEGLSARPPQIRQSFTGLACGSAAVASRPMTVAPSNCTGFPIWDLRVFNFAWRIPSIALIMIAPCSPFTTGSTEMSEQVVTRDLAASFAKDWVWVDSIRGPSAPRAVPEGKRQALSKDRR